MRKVRRVKIGPNVKVSEDGADLQVGEQPLSQALVIGYVCDTHVPFNNTGRGIKTSARIAAAFRGKGPGDIVELDEAEWTLLRDALLEGPSEGFFMTLEDPTTKEPVTLPGRLFLPCIEAVETAELAEVQ